MRIVQRILVLGRGTTAGETPVVMVAAPASAAAAGSPGQIAEDGEYLYVYSDVLNQWLRVPISDWA